MKVQAIAFVFLLIPTLVYSQIILPAETDETICAAIWTIEGGRRARTPYGIKYDGCSWEDADYCHRICLNTVRNNRARYQDYGHRTHRTYFEFLASRYAPTEGVPKWEADLNKNWLPNLLNVLDRT